MTAPDHEPICGPSCTPDCGMGHCYLTDGTYIDPEDEHKLNNQANEHAANELLTTPKLAADDLRDRICDAIHAGNFSCPDYHAADCDLCAEQADAAMAVVQPALDAKDAEIARLRALACPGCMAREQERDSWAEATRQTGIKAEEYKRAADHQRQRAEAAERIAAQAEAAAERAAQAAATAEHARPSAHQQTGDQP